MKGGEGMKYHNFENWLEANGESWPKYVCGDLGYKIKMHRRYAIYLEAVKIKKTDRRQAKSVKKINKSMR